MDRLLLNMQRTYDFFEKNPGGTVKQLAAEVDIKEATCFTWCKKALRRGELTQVKGKSCPHNGNIADTYSVVPGKRPARLPPTPPRGPYKYSVDPEARRLAEKSEKVVARRDPLVEALFGAAGAVA